MDFPSRFLYHFADNSQPSNWWFYVDKSKKEITNEQDFSVNSRDSNLSYYDRFLRFCGLRYDSDAKIISSIARKVLEEVKILNELPAVPVADNIVKVFF